MEPFRPDHLPGLAGWWDAADAATVVFDPQSPGRVSALYDKSGNGRTLHNRHLNPNPPALVDNAFGMLPGLHFRTSTYAKLFTDGERMNLARAVTGFTVISASKAMGSVEGNILRIATGAAAGSVRFNQFSASVGIRREDSDSLYNVSVVGH